MNEKWKNISYEEKEEIVDKFLVVLKDMMLGKDVLRMSYAYYADDPPEIRDRDVKIPTNYYSEDRIEIELTRIKSRR